MTIAVQDDSGSVAGANAYASAAFFVTHHTDRGVTAVADGDYETEAIEAALVLATDFLDGRYRFVGDRRAASQATEWPRLDAEDASGHLVVGVPQAIKEACAELALAELSSPGALFPTPAADPSGQAVKRKSTRVDVVETDVEYFSSARSGPTFMRAESRLKATGLVVQGGVVSRA